MRQFHWFFINLFLHLHKINLAYLLRFNESRHKNCRICTNHSTSHSVEMDTFSYFLGPKSMLKRSIWNPESFPALIYIDSQQILLLQYTSDILQMLHIDNKNGYKNRIYWEIRGWKSTLFNEWLASVYTLDITTILHNFKSK